VEGPPVNKRFICFALGVAARLKVAVTPPARFNLVCVASAKIQRRAGIYSMEGVFPDGQGGKGIFQARYNPGLLSAQTASSPVPFPELLPYGWDFAGIVCALC
jgi:hypothetical protein